jgi:hypothetical protein
MVTSTPAAPSIGNVLKQGETTGVALVHVNIEMSAALLAVDEMVLIRRGGERDNQECRADMQRDTACYA